jgi:tetratricopeptide (TPR) repeat protein
VIRILLALAAAVLAACTIPGAPLPEDPARELVDVPFFPQTAWHCGPAALATVLAHSGVSVTPEDLAPRVYVPGRRGSFQPELAAASRSAGRLPYVLEPTPEALFAEVAAGNPVLVLQDVGRFGLRRWHYAVVVGWDDIRHRVILRSGTERRRVETLDAFLRSWEPGGRWALVVTRPGELPATAAPGPWVRTLAEAADRLSGPDRLEAHQAALDRWPEETTVLFAVANERYAQGYLRAAQLLYRRLLAREPDHVAGGNNLANVLLDRGCPREARVEAERVLALARQRGEFVDAVEDTLGRIQAAPDAPCPIVLHPPTP